MKTLLLSLLVLGLSAQIIPPASVNIYATNGGEGGVWNDGSSHILAAIEQTASFKPVCGTCPLYTIALGDATSATTWASTKVADIGSSLRAGLSDFNPANCSMGNPHFSIGPTAGSAGNGNLVFLMQKTGATQGNSSCSSPASQNNGPNQGQYYNIWITKGPFSLATTITSSNTTLITNLTFANGEGYFDPILLDANSTTSYLITGHRNASTGNACTAQNALFSNICTQVKIQAITMSGASPVGGSVIYEGFPFAPAAAMFNTSYTGDVGCYVWNKPEGATLSGTTFTLYYSSNAWAAGNGDGYTWTNLTPIAATGENSACSSIGGVLGASLTARAQITTGGAVTGTPALVWPPSTWPNIQQCANLGTYVSLVYNEWGDPVPCANGDECIIVDSATHTYPAQVCTISAGAKYQTNFNSERLLLDISSGQAWGLTNWFQPGSAMATQFGYTGLVHGGSAREQYEPVTKQECANVSNTSGINNAVCFGLNYSGSPLYMKTTIR